MYSQLRLQLRPIMSPPIFYLRLAECNAFVTYHRTPRGSNDISLIQGLCGDLLHAPSFAMLCADIYGGHHICLTSEATSSQASDDREMVSLRRCPQKPRSNENGKGPRDWLRLVDMRGSIMASSSPQLSCSGNFPEIQAKSERIAVRWDAIGVSQARCVQATICLAQPSICEMSGNETRLSRSEE